VARKATSTNVEHLPVSGQEVTTNEPSFRTALPALEPRRPVYLRDLLRELVVRDFKLRYNRSVLGIAWSRLVPLARLTARGAPAVSTSERDVMRWLSVLIISHGRTGSTLLMGLLNLIDGVLIR
jgi:hypothetical protein